MALPGSPPRVPAPPEGVPAAPKANMRTTLIIANSVSGKPSALVLSLVLLLFGVAAACLVVAWRRSGRGTDAKGRRGRLREVGWCAALVALAAVVTANLYPALVRGPYWWWLLVIPLAAVAVIVLRPRLAAVLVPVSLILLGVTGLGAARAGLEGAPRYGYGAARVADPSTAGLILAQAYAAVLVGGWLAWRQLARRPAAARVVLGRTADPDRPAQRSGVLLLLVCVLIATLIGSNAWLGILLTLAAGSMVALRLSPNVAARLATAGLIGIGLVGLLKTKAWAAGGWTMIVAATPGGPGHAPHLVQLTEPTRFFGAVNASGQGMASLAAAEAIGLIGFACWLAPRTFPEVRRLLGLTPDPELTRRVERLAASRAVAVDTAAAELRRLERDLHDGAQARLVALGMNLRAAERLIYASPDAAAALVAEARQTSALALTELRELVRGVHPPVLADRGLADAVRALALDSPLHVETEIDLAGRLPAPVETACYFAVAELLTNAAKHSGARDARIAMSHSDGVLRIEVTDFGLGGANPAAGSGLAGVEKRLATFDGILAVSSPAGGPTIVILEVPCALSSPRTSSC